MDSLCAKGGKNVGSFARDFEKPPRKGEKTVIDNWCFQFKKLKGKAKISNVNPVAQTVTVELL